MAAIASSSNSSVKSPSPSSNLSLLISNLNAFVSVKLDASNFIIWKNQWQNILKATGLYSFVDGTGVAPSTKIRDSTNQEVTNLEFLQWMVDDAHLMSCISETLSSAVYPVVINCGSSRETWSSIEKRFTSLSRSHIHQLKNRLTSTVKGSNTMDVYLQQIKNLNDKLTLAGSQIDSEDLVLITLNGLSDDYRAFKTSIRTRSTPIAMEELCALLLSEAIHEETPSKSHSDLNVAFVASRGSYSHQGNRGNYSNRGGYRGNFRSNNRGNYSNRGYQTGKGNFRGGTKSNYTGHSPSGYTQGSQGTGFSSGSSGSSSSNTVCQICDKPGHTAFNCWHRLNMEYQPNSSSGSYASSSATKAYVASVPEQTNSNWYVDSAASTHITNDLSSLSLYEPYQGSEQVTIGNGTTLPIHNTGNGQNPQASAFSGPAY
ncbi:hypothetical protein Vadar_015050 [Vaccinium darrowii]|uniref:Uncharacterized protein n=1 Tax=Vaccinium darrowii TaxID=229202 RepID=A0ACB7XAF0_9ERIC|nr:hypothetical protein Vadar_015050 [Vaccinium darrowii]